ncbi:restriction endonuclease subunit S [Burkholderia pseudomallei]|uniref:restriction endonuclease subunit S n=1 Tax=Burkholderia pseudomallei TaxID=28450 RepID=UPI000F0531B9|nr:restriction endonuclease subunit S [Burkholderia pseudomallei]VBS86043.1 restriction endonuclease S subunits-like protein [Burkholderia pseudomallei]
MRPGYKQTEAGVIPSDWKVVAFGTLASIERGKFSARPRNDPKYYGGDFPFLQTGDVTRAGGKITSYSQTLNVDGVRVSRLFPRGTLFFTIAANIGDVGISDFDAACPDSLVAISPKASSEKKWLLYELASRKEEFELLATPGAQLNINLEKLRPYLLPLPPLPEQSAIATALSDIDALLCSLDALIAKKSDIKKAAMQQFLTGKTRLPGFEDEWEVRLLGDVADVKTGPFGSSLHERDYVLDGTPIITVEHLGERGVDHVNLPMVSDADRKRLRAYSLEIGDIVFSRVGSIDRNALIRVAEVGWLFSGRLLRVRPRMDIVHPTFLSYQFHSERFRADVRNVAVGQTMASLNTKILNGLVVYLPTLAEQTAIAEVLSDVDAELAALEARRDKTRLLKQGMMQELLTGKTRLV